MSHLKTEERRMKQKILRYMTTLFQTKHKESVCSLLSGQEIRYENPLATNHPDSTTQLIIFSGL